jgi:rRNA maturation RNase YbeY
VQKEKLRNNIKFKLYNSQLKYSKDTDKFLKNLSVSSILKDLFIKTKTNISFIEVNFLTAIEIQKLNNQYRKKNEPTDVLSFNAGTIGEIDLCLAIIANNAIIHNVEDFEELERCIIHGILHLLGFDHTDKFNHDDYSSTKMFIIQENLLKKCRIK